MNKKTIIILIAIFGLVVIIGSIFAFGGNGNEVLHTVEAETLEEQVQTSGKTKPVQEVALGFVVGGKISKSYATVGKLVEPGDILMQLDAADLYADLARAKAELAAESAIFASDSISVAESQENMKNVLQRALIVADNIIRNEIDQFFTGPRTRGAEFRPSVFVNGNKTYLQVDYDDRQDLGDERVEVEAVLKRLDEIRPNLNSASQAVQHVDEIQTHIERLQGFLDEVALVMNRVQVEQDDFLTELSNYKALIAAARFDLQDVVSDILTAKEEINSALAEDIPGDGITARDARILQAQAEVRSIEAQIAKTIIRSPIQGIVTKVDGDPGEIVSSGTTVLSVISDDNFEIESNVSEVNIAKINIGNSVKIVFDGIANKEFWGKVTYVEPAETIVDNVVTFKVKIGLDDESVSPEIKSGLSANLTILTNIKEGVLAIPAYAIINKDGKAFVERYINEEKIETEVHTGIIGSNGFIEITSGLEEGDVIVVAEE